MQGNFPPPNQWKLRQNAILFKSGRHTEVLRSILKIKLFNTSESGPVVLPASRSLPFAICQCATTARIVAFKPCVDVFCPCPSQFTRGLAVPLPFASNWRFNFHIKPFDSLAGRCHNGQNTSDISFPGHYPYAPNTLDILLSLSP